MMNKERLIQLHYTYIKKGYIDTTDKNELKELIRHNKREERAIKKLFNKLYPIIERTEIGSNISDIQVRNILKDTEKERVIKESFNNISLLIRSFIDE